MLKYYETSKSCLEKSCGQSFTPVSARQMYCNPTCRSRAFRARHNPTNRLTPEKRNQRRKQIPQNLSNVDAVYWYLENRTIPKGDCILWTGHTWQGYGRIGLRRLRTTKESLVHRFFYSVLVKETIEPIHHKCGNTLCVNVLHLEPTTQYENTLEMLTRRGLEARIAEMENLIADWEASLIPNGMVMC